MVNGKTFEENICLGYLLHYYQEIIYDLELTRTEDVGHLGSIWG